MEKDEHSKATNSIQTSQIDSIRESENFQDIIKKLEKDGENNLKEVYKQNNITCDSLTNITKKGEKEIVKRTGRRMTYAEMR